MSAAIDAPTIEFIYVWSRCNCDEREVHEFGPVGPNLTSWSFPHAMIMLFETTIRENDLGGLLTSSSEDQMLCRPINLALAACLLIGLTGFAGCVDRALAHTDCDIYARYTALQLRTNIEDRCKYTGSLGRDLSANIELGVKDVAFDEVRKVLGERQKLLAACRQAVKRD